MDEAAFRTVAGSCGISNLLFLRVAERSDRRTDHYLLPFRRFYRWWRERRSLNQGMVRRCIVDFPVRIGGIGSYGREPNIKDDRERSLLNRKFDGLKKEISRFGVIVTSKYKAIVD